MNKKYVLWLMLGFMFQVDLYGYYDSYSYRSSSDSTTVIYGVAAAVTALLTISYWSQREPNSVKIHRANEVWDTLHPVIKQCSSLQDMQLFLSQFNRYNSDLWSSYHALNNRYNSYLKPWNWSEDMQLAYLKIDLLATIFLYKDLICMWHTFYNDAAVVSFLKKSEAMVQYPLISVAAKLDRDLKNLDSSISSCVGVLIVKDLLNVSLQAVLGSAEYASELHFKRMEELQRRAAQAAEQSAWAAQRAARAAERTAAASEKAAKQADNKDKYWSSDNSKDNKDKYWSDSSSDNKDKYW